MPGDDLSVPRQAVAWRDEGRRVALATVLATWGSAPRPAGAHMALDEAGAFAGSVSGGCVEAAVLEAADAVLRGGDALHLEYGVADEEAWGVGLACGGRVRIRLEAVDEELAGLLARLDAAMPAVLATHLGTGERALLRPLEGGRDEMGGERVEGAAGGRSTAGAPDRDGPGGPEAAAGEAGWPVDDARRALLEDRSRVVASAAGDVFLRAYNPPVRVVLVGAVHVAQPLARMAGEAGFHVTVVDPRRAFAGGDRFDGVDTVERWPGEALAALRPDRRTAVVTLTHDPKLDEPALEAALATQAFYVGALGSRRTHARRLERLSERGVASDALRRIHAPVGLDIGARAPGEIAVAVLAEIVGALRAGTRAPAGDP